MNNGLLLITRIITQFRTFTLGSYTKQLMNRLYVLAKQEVKIFILILHLHL